MEENVSLSQIRSDFSFHQKIIFFGIVTKFIPTAQHPKSSANLSHGLSTSLCVESLESYPRVLKTWLPSCESMASGLGLLGSTCPIYIQPVYCTNTLSVEGEYYCKLSKVTERERRTKVSGKGSSKSAVPFWNWSLFKSNSCWDTKTESLFKRDRR